MLITCETIIIAVLHSRVGIHCRVLDMVSCSRQNCCLVYLLKNLQYYRSKDFHSTMGHKNQSIQGPSQHKQKLGLENNNPAKWGQFFKISSLLSTWPFSYLLSSLVPQSHFVYPETPIQIFLRILFYSLLGRSISFCLSIIFYLNHVCTSKTRRVLSLCGSSKTRRLLSLCKWVSERNSIECETRQLKIR